mgnify:CR=1 FL=1
MAHSHQDATTHDHGRRGEPELFRSEQSGNDDISARLHLTVDLQDDSPAHVVEHEGLLGFGKAELDEVVEKSIRKAGLWEEVKDRLEQPGTGLSGGQQQRLCVARGVAVRPEVLLLDEPTSALDPISSAKLEDTVTRLKADHTIVIVTHNLGQAARVSDYTGFMYLGELVEFGATHDVFTRPATPRTSDYITGRFG